VLLGACPGQDEWNAHPQRPFAGRSGINLRHLLEVLRDLPNKGAYGLQAGDFLSANIDDYTLMNAHADAKWLAQHGRSMPRMSEIEAEENLLRLSNQLRFVGARFVIGLGRSINDAHLARQAKDSGPLRAIRLLMPSHPGVSFCISGHPSQQAVNRYGEGNPRQWFERTLCRL
jgi:uracil-DNA glycosylase